MSGQAADFLDRDDVRQTLGELFKGSFARIAETGAPDPLPDVRGFLQVRGIEAPSELRLELHHAVDESVDLEADVQPLAPICDEKGTRGYTVCERIKGKTHCYWVCPKVG